MGDSGDHYPGVRGIGEKTGLKLLQAYHSIEGILENLESLTAGQRAKIEEDLSMLHLSRKLAKIHCEVDVSQPLNEAIFQIDQLQMEDKFQELELKNLNNILL